jgi:hypothetical protein
MAGLLTHLSIALIGFLIITIFSRSYKYGLAFVIGHVITDATGIFISAVKLETINLYSLVENPAYWKLNSMVHNPYIWISVFAVIFIFIILLFKADKIKKDVFEKAYFANVLFLIGVIIHLVIDQFIFETNRLI